jgi:hypothetical protein
MPNNRFLWKIKLPLKVKIFLWFLFKRVILTTDNQYYKGRVACDLCVTQNYCVPNNPMRQSTWPMRFLRGRSTCRCITSLALHKLWTKFWNVMLQKIIFFSPMSGLAPACTQRHEIIRFHNVLLTNVSSFNHKYFLIMIVFNYLSNMNISLPCLWPIIFQTQIFSCHVCVQITHYYFPYLYQHQSLDGYKNRFLLQNQKHIYWDLSEKGIALDFMHVCDCSKFYLNDNLWYCYVLYIM